MVARLHDARIIHCDIHPNKMFLDIGLPHMDGYEVARQLRSGDGHAPMRLVALTGYGQTGDR
jgi:CheY-like chemotaxis protein